MQIYTDYNKVKKVAESCQTQEHIIVANKLITQFMKKYNLEYDEQLFNISKLRDSTFQSVTKYLNANDKSPKGVSHILDCVNMELLDDSVIKIELVKVDDGKVEIFVNGKYTGRHKL
jgi:hypothetical protein